MKRRFANFWLRNLGFFRLAVISNMEYRVNFITDVLIQPMVTTAIEFTLWFAVFRSTQQTTLMGFGLSNYLSYALWASFIGRISSNWMYEFRMITEIDKGTINSILVRPMSFYEFYLSQFLGYKLITTAFSIPVLLTANYLMGLDLHFDRLPLALLLIVCYLVFAHTLSTFICSFSFFFNRIFSLTAAKNLILWTVTGELFPLDLIPEPYRARIISLPFSSGVFLPVAYLNGRIGTDQILHGFLSVTYGLIVLGIITRVMWMQGLKRYAGTGA